MDRTVLHCDCNAYFASVECIRHPELRNVPMAVCGDPKRRHGIILAKNELAKRYGVKTAEPIWEALRKCPGLKLVVPHHDQYREYCEKINRIYLQYTDRVERFSIDESWLDVTDSLHLYGDGKTIADTLRRRIREELGLTISVGVSFNKVFAKLGSDYKKPDATTVISRENFRDIVWPLPARDMLFVGRAAEDILERAGVKTIGGIAQTGRAQIVALLGRSGAALWDHANGVDNSPVRCFDEVDQVKSVGNSITFSRDLACEADIRAGLTMLADSVATRLRQQKLYCTTVQVQIRDPFLKTIQRQMKLPAATNTTSALFNVALLLVQKAWPLTAPIRLLGVTASGLTERAAEQMDLLDENPGRREREMRRDHAIDAIRARYGKQAIEYARTMQTDILGSADDGETQEKD